MSAISNTPELERATPVNAGSGRTRLKAFALLLLLGSLFYWRILLTNQFSLLTGDESVNQAYSWYQFWITSIRAHILPLWDPYTFSGHSFVGEMQTGGFNPISFLLALLPFNLNGMFSPNSYHLFYVLIHVLGAFFMFLLIQELGLSFFAGIVAGICFAFGGVGGSLAAGWPHLFQSTIWIPLIFLFTLRALSASTWPRRILCSAWAGVFLAMSVLAGGLHIAVMQGIVIASAVVVGGWHANARGDSWREWKSWLRPASVLAIAAAVAIAASLVQLLPSAEYSAHAFRWVGPMLPADSKIPYAYLSDGLYPYYPFALLIPLAFDGSTGGGEVARAYIGVFALLLAAIGAWRNWSRIWVRYCAGLVVLGFAYALTSSSLLHGLLYALVPYLWMAREAGRFLYLVDFGLVVLAAYGIDSLLSAVPSPSWDEPWRIVKYMALACIGFLSIPAVFTKPAVGGWVALSLMLIIAAAVLFRWVLAGNRGPAAKVVIVAFLLFDLYPFDWQQLNLDEQHKKGPDSMQQLLAYRGAAKFLKSLPGPFRVYSTVDHQLNIGDAFGVETTYGRGVTMARNYEPFAGRIDLLNGRYIIKPLSATDPNPIYQDGTCKIYDNPSAYPRAWLVHQATVEPSTPDATKKANIPGFEARRTALVNTSLGTPLDEAPSDPSIETISLDGYNPRAPSVDVRSSGRALLVLSEIYYPGWTATVNGKKAAIVQVDGALRGVVVPAGESRVSLRYRPGSILVWATVSVTSIATLLIATLAVWFRRRVRPLESRPIES